MAAGAKEVATHMAGQAGKALKQVGRTRFDASTLFDTDVARLGELRAALEGSSERDQLEAMRRLIGMLSKDIDVSQCFPSVVKLVVSPHAELKRLAHMYLVHYADVEPDTILLSINTFQKDMRGPNQLIRASALRVMSSIRVRMITQPVVLAIRAAIIDSSAYVRRAAAAAVLKVHSVDPDLKDELVEILTSLLKDNSPLVLGATVVVFNELCPERHDVVHRVYRKLCHMIADMDEWGQIATLQLLLPYAKSQFLDPHPDAVAARKKAKAAAKGDGEGGDGDEQAEDEDDEDDDMLLLGDEGDLDPDHRLLLKSTQVLLQSRASAVVYATVALHLELAPPNEQRAVGRAMVRLLRGSRESQWIALQQCATVAATKPDVLRQHMADFFVSRDTNAVASMKLEILTHLVDESNISKVLREFASYVKQEDKRFVRATIQAIGRCATRIPAVLDSCIASLMRLLSNRNEDVVAEAVIVLKRLLQTPAAAENDAVIRQLARLLESIAVPTARAAITWLCGEYHKRIELYAPDVLRQLARSFALEDTQVKLQVLTLGAKLFVARPDDVRKLFEYVLTLAKYDQDYDVRDRARLLRLLLLGTSAPALAAHAQRLLETAKPVPVYRSEYAARAQWTLGSLSFVLGQEVSGYTPLPDFPLEQPDASTRDNELDVSSIGQSMSSDVQSIGYVPSHQGSTYAGGGGGGGGGAKTGGGATPGADDGDTLFGDDLDGFYDDDEGANGALDASELYLVEDGTEGDEEYGYYDDDGEWVFYTQEELDEYYEQDSSAAAYYGDDGDELFDPTVAAADEEYLVQSGDLPTLTTPDDFVVEDDDGAEDFFAS